MCNSAYVPTHYTLIKEFSFCIYGGKMARKRMFDLDVINQDTFLDLPMDAIALYFLLGMEADDEGFINPKKVLKLYGGKEDSIKILIMKGYLIPFETGVVVITDWKRNNYLQKDRIKPTIYQDEKSQIKFDEIIQKYTMFNNCLTDVNIEEKRRDQKRIEEKRSEENRTEDLFVKVFGE